MKCSECSKLYEKKRRLFVIPNASTNFNKSNQPPWGYQLKYINVLMN